MAKGTSQAEAMSDREKNQASNTIIVESSLSHHQVTRV